MHPDINAIVQMHTHHTIGVSVSAKFRHVIEEAKIVVGEPTVIANRSSGSTEFAKAVSEFKKGNKS